MKQIMGNSQLLSAEELGVPIPTYRNLVVRPLRPVTREQRERALQATEYNGFSFPAELLTLDFLSDSGTTAMIHAQWAAMFYGDESYGRNTGYFALLEAFRDTFERGNSPKRAIDDLFSGTKDTEMLMDEIFLAEYQGGLVNGGKYQLIRPNTFIVPQGRCAENLLFSTLARVLHQEQPGKEYFIPSNGHFDTTEGNIHAAGLHPVNLFSPSILGDYSLADLDRTNPFKGDINVEELEKLITAKGRDAIPMIYLTVTNNTAAGQPVSLKNIKAVKQIADKYEIPLFLDACRFAENAYFIKEFEEGYAHKSIPEIVQEMFAQADGATVSFKKDGLANIGGGLFFRDQGVFHNRFSTSSQGIGVLLKEAQILTFGNDSYGGMSGRDIMALSVGLYEVVKESYLSGRIKQVRNFARKLAESGVPVILPPGGHAVYVDMDKFFDGKAKPEDFKGVGFTLELIRQYGIRGCELGNFSFDWDKKDEEARKGILNLVRFALPRNTYGQEHIDYATAAIIQMYKNRDCIPRVEVTRGRELKLRHFQTGLRPVYE